MLNDAEVPQQAPHTRRGRCSSHRQHLSGPLASAVRTAGIFPALLPRFVSLLLRLSSLPRCHPEQSEPPQRLFPPTYPVASLIR